MADKYHNTWIMTCNQKKLMLSSIYGYMARGDGMVNNALFSSENKNHATGESGAASVTGIVDGETLKPGVWYTVENGEWWRC